MSLSANAMIVAGGACMVYAAGLFAPAAAWFLGGALLSVSGLAVAIQNKRAKTDDR